MKLQKERLKSMHKGRNKSQLRHCLCTIYPNIHSAYTICYSLFLCSFRLPVPWLLYGIIYGEPVEVNSVGMVCSITILFMMLIFVILSIACFRWKMNRGLGFTMFLLYFVFVAVSLMFEYEIIVCPVQGGNFYDNKKLLYIMATNKK